MRGTEPCPLLPVASSFAPRGSFSSVPTPTYLTLPSSTSGLPPSFSAYSQSSFPQYRSTNVAIPAGDDISSLASDKKMMSRASGTLWRFRVRNTSRFAASMAFRSASAPYHAVPLDRSKRIDRPVGSIHGDNVLVGHEQQRSLASIAFEARHNAVSPGYGFEDFRIDARIL